MIFFRRGYDFDPNWEMTPALRWRIWTSGWRGALVLLILTLAGLGWWKGADTYQRLKVWRAERLIGDSAEAREQGDFSEADRKLRQAVALLGREPRTLRAVAHHKLATHDLSALNTYAELIQTGKATQEDKVTFCRQAFRLGRSEMVTPVLRELREHPEGKESCVVLALLAEASARDGRWPEALKLARQSCDGRAATDQDMAYAKWVLARLLVQPSAKTQDANFALVTEGLDLMSSVALLKGETGLDALEMLVNLSRNPQFGTFFLHRDVQALINAPSQHPTASAELKVGLWNLRFAAEPSLRAEIEQEFFDRFRNDSSAALRLEAARWMNRRGMHRQVLEMAKSSKLDSKDWFLLYLDATAALGSWEEVYKTLTAPAQTIPLTPALQKLFELRSEIETGRHPDAAASWRWIQAALRNESGDEQLYVAGYAEQIHFPVEAAEIYRRLLSKHDDTLPAEDKLTPPKRRACYLGLLRTGASAMTLGDLSELMGRFAEEFPEMDEVQNDHAYLQLLAGQNLDEAATTARRLSEKKPELLAFRTTLALAALRRNDIAAAQAVYNGWAIDWNTAQDRYKAVYAAVMRAAGRKADADKVASTINGKALRFEELQLAGVP